MKEKELRERTTCAVCRRKIGHTGLPLFWTVKIERHGVNIKAVNRQQGLAMFFGGGQAGAMLASVMGPNEEMTKPVMAPVEVTICEECCIKDVCIAELAERFSDEVEEEKP